MALAKKLKTSGKPIPRLYSWCGTEDFLLEQNREFHRYLTGIEVPHVYLESKGSHDMVFWNEYTLKFVEMMFGENN